MKNIPFHDLPVCPSIIADCVLSEPYTAQEWSDKVRDGYGAKTIEAKRQALTNEQRNAFVMECERRCFEAHKSGAKWFSEIIQARGNAGRDKLHLFTRHWLCAFLSDLP